MRNPALPDALSLDSALIERRTRLVILTRMGDNDADSALQGFRRCLMRVPSARAEP